MREVSDLKVHNVIPRNKLLVLALVPHPSLTLMGFIQFKDTKFRDLKLKGCVDYRDY